MKRWDTPLWRQEATTADFINQLRKALDMAEQSILEPFARQDQQPARGNVDTADLKRLLFAWHGAADGPPSVAAYHALIAHINAWGGVK